MDTKDFPLEAIKPIPKSGNEYLTFNEKSVGYSLFDFWQWSVSDLLINTTRGRLAEFIVGTAFDINPKKIRSEWELFDIETETGIKIEVKSAAYIQSWRQKKYSPISFSIKKTQNYTSKERKRHADVYVFCLLKMKDQQQIDPLKLEQWEFYVLPTCKIDNYARSQTSITLNSLLKITNPTTYKKLKNEVENCHKEQKDYLKIGHF